MKDLAKTRLHKYLLGWKHLEENQEEVHEDQPTNIF